MRQLKIVTQITNRDSQAVEKYLGDFKDPNDYSGGGNNSGSADQNV